MPFTNQDSIAMVRLLNSKNSTEEMYEFFKIDGVKQLYSGPSRLHQKAIGRVQIKAVSYDWVKICIVWNKVDWIDPREVCIGGGVQ